MIFKAEQISQISFADLEYAILKKKNRKELLHDKLDTAIAWRAIATLLPNSTAKLRKTGGRPQYPLQTLLCVHVMQLVYSLSDRDAVVLNIC